MLEKNQLLSLPNHNNYPRPFNRQVEIGRPAEVDYRSQYVNNLELASQNSNGSGRYRQIDRYPTSTVHKSLMRGQQLCNTQMPDHSVISRPSYSRLISHDVQHCSYQDPNQPKLYGKGVEQKWPSEERRAANRDTSSSLLRPLPITREIEQLYPQVDNTASAQDGSIGSNQAVDADFVNQVTRQIIAHRNCQQSNLVTPNNNVNEFMRDKKIEQISIANQTYRTLPIVAPKPKTRHDLATGCYMYYNQDPTWDIVRGSNRRAQSLKITLDPHPNSMRSSSNVSEVDKHEFNTTYYNRLTFNVLILIKNTDRNPQQIERSTNQSYSYEDPVPIFNYREYIESTRKA